MRTLARPHDIKLWTDFTYQVYQCIFILFRSRISSRVPDTLKPHQFVLTWQIVPARKDWKILLPLRLAHQSAVMNGYKQQSKQVVRSGKTKSPVIIICSQKICEGFMKDKIVIVISLLVIIDWNLIELRLF